ncbi:MAG: NHL repeat-containing protein [Nitrospirota bacterium]|nr:NHL repeat-containing protein [Nitrospirota bacterium]
MFRILVVIISFVIPFLLVQRKIEAQLQDVPVVHAYSIVEGEEDRLFFPSFVWAEPVSNEVYVIDGKSRIIIYTSDFFPLFTLDSRKGIESPQGLTLDAEGNMYVAQSATKDNPRHRISVFNACLKWVRDIYLEGFEGSESFNPYRLAMDKAGNIYVAGSYFPGVLVLTNQGRFLEVISPEEEGRKVKLNDVTLDKAGRIYLVSEEMGHIYVYDENRKFLFKFGRKGGSTGKLSRPMAVGVDNRNGRMYVVDYMRHTVSVYDKDGKYLFEFGGLGLSAGWFQFPRDISVDSTGRILIADTFNNRVEVYQPKE